MKDDNFKLYAPLNYWNATKEQLDTITNGCGTAGWKGLLVPETLFGLSVSESCNIHDWMYHHGKTVEDKEEADRVFLNNMTRTVNAKKSFWLLRKLRLWRAKTFYNAVKDYGSDAFWANKNNPEEFRSSKDAHAKSA